MTQAQHYIVVDDDPTNNIICKYTIQRFNSNAEVKLFQQPEKALEVLENTSFKNSNEVPTVLFLDVNMPSMTGWEFLEEFNGFESSLKNRFMIYILTSSIEDFSEQTELFPFVCGFLSKPLKIGYLDQIKDGLNKRLLTANNSNVE